MNLATRTTALILSLGFGVVIAGSNLAEGADFRVSEGNALQNSPAVAYDSKQNRYLSVWTDFRNQTGTGLDVYGRIVTAQGKPVASDIAITTAKKGQAFSAVGFDSVNNRFLVVWTDWRDAATTDSDIYGQIVGADGGLIGDNFPIANLRVSQKFPTITFDPVRQRYLVVWVDNRDQAGRKIYGRFVGTDGRLLGDDFAITTKGGGQDGASIAYDEGRKRFLAVWRDVQENGIFGTFVDAELSTHTPPFPISIETETVLPPTAQAVALAPGEGVYFVTWTSRENSATRGMDVYGAFIDAKDGGLRGSPFLIAAETDHQRYAVTAYDPGRKRFLVAWYDLRRALNGINTDIYGRFIYADGRRSPEFVVSDLGAKGGRRYSAISFSPETGTFFVLWEDERSKENRGRRIFGTIK